MATKKHTIHYKPAPTQQLLMALGLFIVAAVLAGDSLSAFEEAIFQTIYELPSFVEPYMLAITQLGNIFVLFGIAGFYMLKAKYHIMLRLLLSGTLAYLLSGVAKDLVGRGRPLDFIEDLFVRDLIVRGPGFPSGHTALATALALSLAPFIPRHYRWLVVVLIIGGVGLSRIYLGVHAPLDVVGGIAIGWFAATVFRYVDIRDKYHHPGTKNQKSKKRKSVSKKP